MRRFTVVFSVLLCCAALYAEDWQERMLHQMDKRISVELQDEKIADAVQFLSAATGLNIVLAPDVRKANPSFTLRAKDMEAGNVLQWIVRLTETHLEIVDQALYITSEKSKESVETEKKNLLLFAAERGVVPEMPPDGVELTDQERIKIGLQIAEKEKVTVQDFPGPEIGLDFNKK